MQAAEGTCRALPFLGRSSPPQAADPQSPFVSPVDPGNEVGWRHQPELCYSLASRINPSNPEAAVAQLATDGLVLDSAAAAAWLQASTGNTNECAWGLGTGGGA